MGISRYQKNIIAASCIKIVAIFLIVLLFFIIGYMIYEILPLFQFSKEKIFNWSQLFQRSTAQGYQEAGFYWQPITTNYDTPKFSLIPLLIGSLKGAIYALLFATPFALGSAIYVSRFLHRRLASYIKGAIELLASFPTVVLAFLGLTLLAPLFEHELILLILLLLLPLFIVLFFSVLHWISPLFTYWSQEWQRLLSVSLLIILTVLILIYNNEDIIIYSGRLINKFEENISYARYNTLVISIAMAIAILPIIFTIAEDAFSSVPKSLIQSSLALGATSWQTVLKIILPMAGPGIIVALLMGLMRGLGETMILLIAVDQTPVTNWSLFEGLRSITSTLMIELGDASPNSIHYHILFLSAFILFILTLVINTLAELIRYRLKRKYDHW